MGQLTSRLANHFSASVRARGDGYARGGNVRNLLVATNEIKARVVGSEEYDVRITIARESNRWDLVADCSCPYVDSNGDPCKHIWATLLAADKGYSEKLGPIPHNICIELYDPDAEGNEYDDEDDDVPVVRRTASAAPQPVSFNINDPAALRTALKTLERGMGSSAKTSSGSSRQTSVANLRAMLQDSFAVTPTASKPEPPKPAPPPEPPKPKWLGIIKQASQMHTSRPAQVDRTPLGEPLYVLDLDHSSRRSTPTVQLLMQYPPSENGKTKAPTKLTVSHADVPTFINPADRIICGMLLGAATPGREWGYSHNNRSEQPSSLWQVEFKLLPLVFPLMQQTGRFRLRRDEQSPLTPLVWDERPWEFVLAMSSPAGNDEAEMRPSLRRVGDSRPPHHDNAPVVIGDRECIAIQDGAVSPVRSIGSTYFLSAFRNAKSPIVRRTELSSLLSELSNANIELPVAWPEKWNVAEITDLIPQPRLTLYAKHATAYVPTDGALAEVSFDYQGVVVPAESRGMYVTIPPTQPTPSTAPSDTPPPSPSGEIIARRNLESEKNLIARLKELGVRDATYRYSNQPPYSLRTKIVPKIVPTLIAEGWSVVGDDAMYRRPGAFKMNVSSGIDWFNLNVTYSFDDQTASAAALLDAVKRGDRFVTLSDGSLGVLPEEWLNKHGRWLQLAETDKDAADGSLRFSKAQVGLIDALLAELPEATCDAQVQAARKRLASFAGVAPRTEPSTFRGTLREYQRTGLGWLSFIEEFGFGGILADDMGLGKTVQLLAHVAETRALETKKTRKPWLIVAPKTLVFNWAREAQRFTPELKVMTYTGVLRKDLAQDIPKTDLVLTTYGTLRTDVASLSKIPWACVVLDESQAIKNAESQSAKAARLVGASSKRRLALSGTPIENSIDDLWSVMEFLNPGMLGGARAFRSATSTGSSTKNELDTPLLRRALRPFILRRTKDVVAPELPPRSEQTIVCELPPAQRKFYDGLLAHYRNLLLGKDGRVAKEGLNKSRIHVLEALLRLRQAACHPALITGVEPSANPTKGKAEAIGKSTKPASKAKLKAIADTAAADSASSGAPATGVIESAKIESLLSMLEEIGSEHHKALVFSQFTSFLSLVRTELDKRSIKYEYLDGDTSSANRAAAVDRFQNADNSPDSASIFLISLKAGGVGLNLTAADYVFLLDPWWNPAVEAQAIDRTHRIGQQKKVIAYRLIAANTVEQRIQELQATKRDLAAAIVGQDQTSNVDPLASLTREDLTWLLS